MHWLDILIFFIYMVVMLGIGFFFLRQNKSDDDYYVGGRSMGSWHVGLSVVATDVGGGFSIGLGGLGFTMGISGSWMLFTGLIGAWLSAVVLIPRVSRMSKLEGLYTFPQIFGLFYNKKVALLAGVISAVGYLGFTSSQMLAGAKLASATFTNLDLTTALLVMGVIAVVYTVMGGIKAVIYTDTVQWIILMSGLIFIGIPVAYHAIGGWDAIVATLPAEFLRLDNLTWQTLVNWAVTIIPIWFVGMTLYQRIYSCKGPKEAQKAWFIAGLFEWPVMALMGVVLGLFARVAAEQGMFDAMGYAGPGTMDEEIGLPLLLRDILPIGLLGLMMSAYFSAILSTADSCLMAASGNIVTDILGVKSTSEASSKANLRMSQWITLVVGVAALLLATTMENVLELMLYSYAFLVSGLLVPLVAALFGGKVSSIAAFWSMLVGGATTVALSVSAVELPLQLDPNVFGISASAITFFVLNLTTKKTSFSYDKL